MLKWYIHVIQHKLAVLYYILRFCVKLIWRGVIHDNSKFNRKEAVLFSQIRPKLAKSTYGSADYNRFLEELKPALANHYKNRHHPESTGTYYECNGCFEKRYSNQVTHCPKCGYGQFTKHVTIDGMSFLDITEMWFDWLAATKKHEDGNIAKSIEYNTKRFELSSQIINIMHNSK